MIIVSYTRLTPGIGRSFSIDEQNEIIKKYAQSKKMQVSKKYTDRKTTTNSVEGLNKLKEDAVSRKFDGVVFSSLKVFGENSFVLFDIIRDLFIPTGVAFAIADESYYSRDHSSDENSKYIKGKYREYKTKYSLSNLKAYTRERKYEKFGFLYGESADELIIDDYAATIVRDIFQKTVEGYTTTQIAKEISEAGIPVPVDYANHRLKPEEPLIIRSWNEAHVLDILRKELYAGVWERHFAGEQEYFSCPAIVDRETFDRAQQVMDSRRRGCKKKGFCESVFSRSVFDAETGASLTLISPCPETGETLRLNPACRVTVDYPKKNILSSELSVMVKQRLLQEKRAAISAKKSMETEEVQNFVRQKNALIDEEIREIIEEMIDISSEYLPAQINESEDVISSLDSNMESLERKLKKLEEKKRQLSVAYSTENPWIKLYSKYDGRTAITRELIKQYTERIIIYRFESIDIESKEHKWKELIPGEWIEG